MIVCITPDANRSILRMLHNSTCIGARIEVDWVIAQQNPGVPYHFYMVDDRALLALNTNTALLVGAPVDSEELSLFLSFAGVGQLFSDGWYPDAWKREAFFRLVRQPGEDNFSTAAVDDLAYANIHLDLSPDANDIIQLLESGGKKSLSPAARDRLYTDINIRRNYNRTDIIGFRRQGMLISTAGVWALTKHEAYIACVETASTMRRQGLASLLVQILCRRHGGRIGTLVCSDELLPYYERLGFGIFDQNGILSLPQK